MVAPFIIDIQRRKNNMHNSHLINIYGQIKNCIISSYCSISREEIEKYCVRFSFHPDPPQCKTEATGWYSLQHSMVAMTINYGAPRTKREPIVRKLLSVINFFLYTSSFKSTYYGVGAVSLQGSFYIGGDSLDIPSFELFLHEFIHIAHPISRIFQKRIKSDEDIDEAVDEALSSAEGDYWVNLCKANRMKYK